MKWKTYFVPSSNEGAKKHVVDNISIGAHDHAFTKKLHSRYSTPTGPMLVIAMEGLDLDRVTDFNNAQYYFGRSLLDLCKGKYIPVGDRPIDGLMSFLFDFLRTRKQGLVLLEHWIASKDDANLKPEVRSAYGINTRLAYYRSDVYLVLTPEDTDPEIAEDTIREPWHHWFTGVCATEVPLPSNYIFTEQDLDRIVSSTEHIFVPAFDGEAFLVWSPKAMPN